MSYTISIITINLNNAKGLERTINSVISQTFLDFEYIVIDGGSTDGSIDIIKKYEDKISYWISEPDKGIYNAMNKGLVKATGEYCLSLNSGDFFIDNNILNQVFSQNIIEDIVYGNLLINETNKKWEKTYPDTLTFDYFYKDTLSHPASFIKRKLFYSIGFYNETYKIISDWEFFILAIIKFNCSYRHLNFIISEFQFDGISSKPENLNLLIQEKDIMLNSHFPRLIPDYKELERLRITNKENHKLLKELNDFKKSVFYKFGYKVYHSLKK